MAHWLHLVAALAALLALPAGAWTGVRQSDPAPVAGAGEAGAPAERTRLAPDTVWRSPPWAAVPVAPLALDGTRLPSAPPWRPWAPDPAAAPSPAEGAWWDGRPAARLGMRAVPAAALDAPPPPGHGHLRLSFRRAAPGLHWSRVLDARGADGRWTGTARTALVERAGRTLGAGVGPAVAPADVVAAAAPAEGVDAAAPALTDPARPAAADTVAPASTVDTTPVPRTVRTDTAGWLPPAPPVGVRTGAADSAGDDASPAAVPAVLGQMADLDMRVQTRAELGGDWTRFRPCEERFRSGCEQGFLPRLSPELLFNVQIGGTISERLHVDVDYDQIREFDGANRINIFYEGGPDDVLQRVEVGDVTFALPPSRYLTQGLPAGNFGFQARGQLGPLDFQGVWAEQKGDLSSRVFRLSGVGNQRRFVQEDTLVLDDVDYQRGQFFFVVDPRALDRWPHVDVLALDAGSAPATALPGVEPIQLYRYEADPLARQQIEGFIQADAVAPATLGPGGEPVDSLRESGWFRYLQPGQDYFVHPSGLWVALRNPLAREEMLAVTYITAAGDTVGDYNPEEIYARGGRPTLRLLKATGPNHQPGRPTWQQEMHHVYRVSAAPDVEPASVEVTISVGEVSAGRTFVRSRSGEDLTWLRLLGLDRESPLDRIDAAYVYSPADRGALAGPDVGPATAGFFRDVEPVQGTFVVFPTLEPFKRPPPLPSLGLSEEETAELLGDQANARIYDDPDPVTRAAASVFQLTIPFRVRSEGVISSFSLGALGIREGSERIFLDDQMLRRGIDYAVDYDLGQVQLLQPEALFAARPDASVRATWEQKQIFQTAPISVFGLSGHADVGPRGGVDVIGLYRTEKTLVNRPTLGVEPAAIGLGGLNGYYSAEAPWLDALLERVPGLRFGGASAIGLDGEAALSLPNPNTRGAVFLDDFDATDERTLSLRDFEWVRGSAPDPQGAETVFPMPLDASTHANTVWQDQWIVTSAQGDSLDVHQGYFARQELDRQIRLAGSAVREPGLRLTVGAGRPFPTERWSSLTTVLSRTGTDLTRSEFLEFYVSGGDGATLVVDLGQVSEDALFATADGRTSGIKDNGVPWGLGTLDLEADPSRGQIWGDEADRRGVWDEACLAEPARIYPIGDQRANCTRGNGRRDGEDLDENGNLDTRERLRRYVVRLDGSSPWLARTRAETGTGFRLFRIPLEDLAAIEVGGPLTPADLRAVKHLRVSVVAERPQSLVLARMRIVGSRWITRSDQGVLTGIVGDTAAFTGRMEVSPVSRLSEGAAYSSPPGVLEQLSDPTQAIGGQGVEFNEKSLSLRFEDVAPGDRAEVYNRFPQRPRSFLGYRSARLWVVARGGDFGPDVPTDFFFKVGTDAENFYLYRTRLPTPPGAGSGVQPEDWLPEVRVDFDSWLDLRRRAEEALILDPRGPGEPPVVLWSADSAYAVVLRDRGRAPDLANVRELAFGVWNRGGLPVGGEVWIDELRLDDAAGDPGLAGFVDVRLDAGDVLQTRVSFSGRGAGYRQLDEVPTYQTDRALSVTSRLRVERFLPAGLGVEVPLDVRWDRSGQDPRFLAGSDLQADRLAGLRRPSASRTRVSLGLRKTTPAADPLLGFFVDGLEANVAWYGARSTAITSRLETRGFDARLGVDRRIDPRSIPLLPRFLEDALGAVLPETLAEDVRGARLRWTPERIHVGTSLLSQDNEIRRYDRIVDWVEEGGAEPTRTPRSTLESVAEATFRFVEPLTADVTFLSTRDLVDPAELSRDERVAGLLERERAAALGLDLGWETDRLLRTRVGWRPRFVGWLDHDVSWTTHYLSDRNATFVDRIPVGPLGQDTLLVLARNASGERSARARVSWDPARMADAFLGEAPTDLLRGVAHGLLGAFRPVTWSWDDGLHSRFSRDPVGPGLGFQLGFGDPDAFRVIGADTAATVTSREARSVTSGMLLPAGVELGVAWSATDVNTLDSRSDRTVQSETWPDVQLRRTTGGIPGTPVRRVTLTGGYQRNVRETAFGGLSRQRRFDETHRLPVEVSLGWAEAATLSWSAAFQTGEGVDPTGDTERDRTQHRVSLTSTFLPPWRLSRGFDRPLQLTVAWTQSEERECRTTRFGVDCVAYIDQVAQALSTTLGTTVGGFDVGLQGSWGDRQSFVGQRIGSSQLQVGLFGQFLFEARPGRPAGFLQ